MGEPMTGDLSGYWGLFASAGIALTALGSAVTFLWTRGGKAALLGQQVQDAKALAKAATERADKVQATYDAMLERLHQHMLDDAAAFAKLEAIASEASRTTVASEARLTLALENLGKRIDGMSERFDTFMQRYMSPTATKLPPHG